MAKIKVTGEIIEQETRVTQDGSKSFYTFVVSANDGEVKISDWGSLCKKAGILNQTGIFVEALYLDGQYPRLLSIKEVEKPVGFAQRTVIEAAGKQPASNAAAQPAFRAGRPSDYATSQEYLAFKLAVDLVKDEQIQVDKKIERVLAAQEAILLKWDKEKKEV